METKVIRPQSGPQEEYLESFADIAFYGGAAGGGKTFALLLEPLNHVKVEGFGCVIFRRTSPQIRNEGGLWDSSFELYPYLGAIPKQTSLEWIFPNGNRIKFSHMEYEKDKYNWQGSQIALIGFDEVTQFSRDQFFYMLSRNRSVCGVKPYIRATCNPDSESWVADFISWWIDQDTGFAIPERSGVIRWFIRINDEITWYDTREQAKEATKHLPGEIEPKSVTFIKSSVYDNKILLDIDRSYLSNLHALPMYERQQLLDGNWKVKKGKGMFFKREWFEIVDTVPAGGQEVRFWDRAATEPSTENPDPDYTVGLKMKKFEDMYYIMDVRRFRKRSSEVEKSIKNTGAQDTTKTAIGLEQEPGASGKMEAEYYVKKLAGYNVKVYKSTKDKITRALPASSQAEQGNIKLLRGKWNEEYLTEMDNFDGETGHDDQVDGTSGAFNHLTTVGNFRSWTA